MADEGNLGVARALESDGDSNKEDLQDRIAEARESVTETVTEIKDAASDRFNSVKDSVAEVMDWREQVRKRPVAWSLGALGVGFLLGYGLVELIDDGDKPAGKVSSKPIHVAAVEDEGGGPSAFTDHHSYAAHERGIARVDPQQEHSEANKPGIIDHFKETRAYDRLQEEVADLGNRFLNELANVARSIVLPAFFNKFKEVAGLDGTNKRRSGDTPTRQSGVTPASDEAGPRPIEEIMRSAEVAGSIVPSESGKAAYPRTTLNKFDRSVDDKPSPGGLSDNSPHINLNYDDRYERESKLFSRGEDRGFGARAPGETKSATPEQRSTDSDASPRSVDYKYEPGRGSNDSNS